MRIKLNLTQLSPKRDPSIYWLHVDMTYILLIKQLKKKVQKVLKESRDIELYFDNIPFLDEDDIHAINENEEITVIVKEENNETDPMYLLLEPNDSKVNTVPNDVSSIENINFIPLKFKEGLQSSLILPQTSKKRIRKRTHKKKQEVNQIEVVENNYSNFQSDTSIISSKEPNKMHKRFKLDNECNDQNDNSTESLNEECFQVTKEDFCYNSSPLNSEITQNMTQSKKKENVLKSSKVPVFVRGQTCTPKNSIQNGLYTENNDNKTTESSISEDCDMLVVDWKNMSPVQVLNISDLQIHDLLQFKILSMNENGEPGMSSVITARINHICRNTSHLTILILSGIVEFMKTNPKFQFDDEEIGTEFEVEYNDLFEIFKLV